MAQKDILFVVDGTGSMATFLTALKDCLPEIMQLVRLARVNRVAVLVYRDFDVNPVCTFSGWGLGAENLRDFVRGQPARGGGDIPEAAKTAILRLLSECADRPCTVVWYCDAPPHHPHVGSSADHYTAENAVFARTGESHDWIHLCNRVRDAGHTVHVFLPIDTASTVSFYCALSASTGGQTLILRDASVASISRSTVGLLLTLLGHAHDFRGQVSRVELDLDQVSTLVSEIDNGGLLPQVGGLAKKLIGWTVGAIAENPGVCGMGARVATDAEFRDTAFEVFRIVLQPDMVASLAHNTAFGEVWRAICRERKDVRRDELVELMSRTVAAAPASTREQLAAFIELSYDQTGEVERLIAEAPAGSPMLFLDAPTTFTRSELLELGRSCRRDVLAKVGALLTGLVVVKNNSSGGVPFSTPELFSVLPHLMCPGTLFSRRPAAILAVLAVLTGASTVLERATEHLESIKGSWINMELPENLSADFIRLVLRVPQHLTPAEVVRFEGLAKVAGLLANKATNVAVDVGYASKCTVRPDRKVVCDGCGQRRSSTIMTSSGECGLCVIGDVFEEELLETSYWCECRTCRVHYAVSRKPNVSPKCHFCRMGSSMSIMKARCTLCCNDFLFQTGVPPSDFVCPPCEGNGGKALVDARSATVESYVEQNGAGFLGVAISSPSSFFEARSIFAAKNMASIQHVEPYVDHVFDGKRVLNAEAVRAAIEGWIDRGVAEHGTCSLCYEDLPKGRLLAACGRPGRCDARVCGTCLDAWYGEPKPGHIVLAPNLVCPFCKAPPTMKTMRARNREVMALRQVSTDEKWYYGWCLGCYRLCPAVERECAGEGGIPKISVFRCDDCRDVSSTIDTKECPGCGTAVEKTSGCDHITCPCGTHWCYECRFVSDAHAIYGHIYEAHGGYNYEDEL